MLTFFNPSLSLILWRTFFNDLIKNFPTRIILQNLYHINSVSALHGDKIIHKVSEELLDEFSTLLRLRSRKIEILSSSHSNMEKNRIMQTQYRIIGECLQNNKSLSIGSLDYSCKKEFIGLGKYLNEESKFSGWFWSWWCWPSHIAWRKKACAPSRISWVLPLLNSLQWSMQVNSSRILR